MHKIITPAIITLALAVSSIAAAPVPASAAVSEPTYSISTDVLVRVDEAKGSAHVYAPSGNVSVSWSAPKATTAGVITVTSTQPTRVISHATLTRSGKSEVVKVLRSTQKRIAGKPHYINVDSIVRSIKVAAKK